ncbi:hypothetical protein HanIR_Chr10g0471841 [Helianthus annuus]|nr:hypothetical protein HanIR_Chr10g0471841 [Helianthus annuus]
MFYQIGFIPIKTFVCNMGFIPVVNIKFLCFTNSETFLTTILMKFSATNLINTGTTCKLLTTPVQGVVGGCRLSNLRF